MEALDWLVDTNILLRFSPVDGTGYGDVRRAVSTLASQGGTLYYTSQNLSEFWNVCTRPKLANGFGLSIAKTNELVAGVEGICSLAPESELSHREWRRLVVSYQVSGTQVHDARIVATMRVNRITHLLTLNTRDFRRYSDIVAMSPAELLAQIS
jgi:predicted nucleic acid-binding protein